MVKPAGAVDAAGQPLAGCKVREVAAYLDSDAGWGSQPQTVLAFMDVGPELLYRTRHRVIGTPYHRNGDGIRSEEHTSELQSLMRISYAVFCLKKKKYR